MQQLTAWVGAIGSQRQQTVADQNEREHAMATSTEQRQSKTMRVAFKGGCNADVQGGYPSQCRG